MKYSNYLRKVYSKAFLEESSSIQKPVLYLHFLKIASVGTMNTLHMSHSGVRCYATLHGTTVVFPVNSQTSVIHTHLFTITQ